MNRRKFLKLSAGSAGSLILPSCSAKSLSIPSSDLPDLNKQPLGSHFGLATSLREEFTYKPKIKSKIPTESFKNLRLFIIKSSLIFVLNEKN
jgi:hypothetical protein